MKKRWIAVLVLYSVVPFLCGLAMNGWIMNHPYSLPRFGMISLLFLLAFMTMAFIGNSCIHNTRVVLVSLNLIPLLVLVLIGIQELILHQYWNNMVGTLSQLYYLPLLHLGFQLTFWSPHVFAAYSACFIMLLLISWLGCKLQVSFCEDKDGSVL